MLLTMGKHWMLPRVNRESMYWVCTWLVVQWLKRLKRIGRIGEMGEVKPFVCKPDNPSFSPGIYVKEKG